MPHTHRIRLHGPWTARVASAADLPAGERSQSGADWQPGAGGQAGWQARRVRLPCEWSDWPEWISGSGHRFDRWFHRPTGLKPGDRVYLAGDGWPVALEIRVNDRVLGTAAANRSWRFQVELPTSRNQVSLVVFPETSSEDRPEAGSERAADIPEDGQPSAEARRRAAGEVRQAGRSSVSGGPARVWIEIAPAESTGHVGD